MENVSPILQSLFLQKLFGNQSPPQAAPANIGPNPLNAQFAAMLGAQGQQAPQMAPPMMNQGSVSKQPLQQQQNPPPGPPHARDNGQAVLRYK